ncbi:MAG TPA: TonB-dependent receptor [Kofleriaceae bacterium]|nr:TonB-dependent receptor [Kofleriaceae bacterium]
MRAAGLITIVAALASTHSAAADDAADDDAADDAEDDVDEPIASATSTTLHRRELDHRPHLRARELLRNVPGLYTLWVGAQAPQYLARGYAAGQGADLGVLVDNVPINIGSHAFAHGYADPNFLIADTISSIALHEGAYASRFGSYSVAGTLDIKTLDALPKGSGAVVRISSGTELTTPLLASRLRRLRYQLVGLFSPELERGSALLAAEVGIDDGPYVHPQRYRRGVVLGKWKRPLADGELATSIQFYSGRWFDSGFLSRAAIAASRLTPFSAADPSQGGIAQRASASLAYEVTDANHATWHLAAYVVDSDVRLYANPTLYLRDAMNGDEIEYVDQRVYYGIDAFYRRPHRLGPLRGRLRVGVQARADHADDFTWHDARRLRLSDCFGATNPCTDLSPATNQVAAYLEDHLRYSKHLRFYAGVRLDEESWNVDDRDADTMLGPTSLGGTGSRARIGPKAGILVSNEANDAELSLLAGAGSHSTDARAAVDRSGFGAFIRTYNAELGAKLAPTDTLTAAVATWWSFVYENQVWDPTTATAYRADKATHYGLDARVTFTPTTWLATDASLSTARGTSTPDASASRPPELLQLAPRIMAHAGISVFRATGFVSLRVRAIGARATGDPSLTADGHTIVDLVAAQRFRDFELGLTIDNVLDARWYEQQLASDVRTSRRVDVTRDVLVTPGVPLTALVTLGYVPR